MGEIVNLRIARKRKARVEAAVQADANRAKHGRSKAQKDADAKETARRDAVLDGVKREPE
jgi:Domain of unknown function (DUF4169)